MLKMDRKVRIQLLLEIFPKLIKFFYFLQFEIEFIDNEPIFLHTSSDLSDYSNLIFEDCDKIKIEDAALDSSYWIYQDTTNLEQVSEELEKIEINLKPHVCKICEKKFSRLADLIAHRKNDDHENVETAVEESTAEEILSESEFNLQIVEDDEVETSTENYCEEKLTSKSPEIGNNKLKKFHCSDCLKSFPTKNKLERHSYTHRKKYFVCEICLMRFEENAALENHRMLEHTKGKTNLCNICYRSFASRQSLYEHKVHHKKFSFFCEICNKTLNSKQGLLIHQRFHTNERPFVCKFCQKAFRDGGTLRKHERIHTGFKPHQCTVCQKKFNQKICLREHIRCVHCSEKKLVSPPFICQSCGSEIQDREEMYLHLMKHSDELTETKKKQQTSSKATATVTSSTLTSESN